MNLHLCNKLFYLITVNGFFLSYLYVLCTVALLTFVECAWCDFFILSHDIMKFNQLDPHTNQELLTWYDIITKQNYFINKNI